MIYAATGLLIGAVAGFYFATSADRKELEKLRAEVSSARANPGAQKGAGGANGAGGQSSAQASGAAQSMPSEGEIRELIAKADAQPDKTSYQREVGQGVYLYSLAQGSPALMPEAIRLLKRADAADPKNYQTTLLLGNAHFALGQEGDARRYGDARGYYLRALETKPDDANLHALLGMTYYFASPSDPRRAITEYRKSLAKDPRHEMALQNLASALIATNSVAEAAQRIEELEKINPSNNSLGNLRTQLAQARNSPKERQ